MKNQRKGKSKYVYHVLLIVLAILVNGCGSPARVHNMVATPHSILIANSWLKDNVHLSEVAVGEETKPSWRYNIGNIGNHEFKAALIQSLKDAKYLGTPEGSNYYLSANIIEVDRPLYPLRTYSLTVTTKIEYILIEQNSGEEILKKTIIESYTTRYSHSIETDIISPTRMAKALRLANEGSARNNIYKFLQALSKL